MRFLILIMLTVYFPRAGFAEEAFSVNSYVVELDEDISGENRAAYANDWWQWAASMPGAESPVQDTTGAKCDTNQQGSVWYLAGGYGTSLIRRTCTVPRDRHLFFPVINMLVYPPRGGSITCSGAKEEAARNNNRYTYIRVYIDGVQVQNAERFRVASVDCFNLLAHIPPEVNAPDVSPSATDGYWIMLRPLPVGTHKLDFQAFYTNPEVDFGGMVQNISYDLKIQ